MDSGMIIGIAAVAAVLALVWAVSRGRGRRAQGSDGHDSGGAYVMAADTADGACDSGDGGWGDSGGGDSGGGDCGGDGGGGD